LEFKDLKDLIKKLEKDYAIVMMSEMKMEFKGEGIKQEVAMPEGLSLRQWAGMIKFCDHFLGCDSVGQHLAYAVGTPTTAVIGATFPINVSYPNSEGIKVIDLGMTDRLYDPIRITQDETVNRHNEKLMQLDDALQNYVVGVVKGEIDPDAEEETVVKEKVVKEKK
jgi:ADP-heptose:LPS heptosyltransferase